MVNTDIVIVGGGMVGLALAGLLKQTQHRVMVINRGDCQRALPNIVEPRVSALNVVSQQLLTVIGAWQALDHTRLCPYTDMNVWEQDSFARIAFSHRDTQHTHLGTIVENQNIANSLYSQVSQQSNVTLKENTEIRTVDYGEDAAILALSDDSFVSAKLVVGADGAESWVRKSAKLPMTFWHYDQHAIVATIKTQVGHDQTARQAFTPSGPLAFLPLNDPTQCSIVWSQDTEQAQHLMALDDDAFCKALAVALDMQLGPCELLNQRVCIPLQMRYVRQWVDHRVVVIGDAAHTIHPLAGQGVNLGFVDALRLAEALSDIAPDALGQVSSLRSFERERKSAAVKMVATMEGFKQLFSGNDPVKKLIRGLGMRSFDQLGPVKRTLIEQAMGG